MSLFDSTVRPSQQASDIGGLRGKLMNSVFPSVPAGTPANSPAAPTAENRTRAQAPVQQSAASRAASAVAAHLAANPVKPVAAPVKATRENTPLTQSAGTINTNYVNSATAQGYAGVTPPNIYRGMAEGHQFTLSGLMPRANGEFQPSALVGASAPDRTRESFRNNVFVPSPAQVRANLFNPRVPAASAILAQPLAPQVGVPLAQFPPRQGLLNYLFPR